MRSKKAAPKSSKTTTAPKSQPSKPSLLILIILGIFLLIVVFVALCLSPFANSNPEWKQPQMLSSQNGLLEVTLNASNSATTIGGKPTQSMVYNGDYPGKSWEVRGGDTIKVHLQNNIDQPTNLHFHGSHVSPKGNSDNVLLQINPGEDFEYEYHLPENHPPGLYWYHPHFHPYVEGQVQGGMAGAIIVRGNVDELPGIKGVPERMWVLTTNFDPQSNETIRYVNGQLHPTMYLRPGQTTRIRVVNASADDYYNLAIPGEKLHIISRDGNTLSHVQSVDNEVMAPGDRIDFLFTPGFKSEYPVMSMAFDQGNNNYHERQFMTIKVQGLPMLPTALPSTLIPYDNFQNATIDNARTLTFSVAGTTNNPVYLLDGKEFNANTISQIMELGTTEEWYLVNESNEAHPFHIHINPFQVVSINGEPVDRPGLDDTFSIPAQSTVVIRTKYRDFDGKYVLHCHILFHEDNGMMQVVEVVPPGGSPAPDNGRPDREGLHGAHMNHGVSNADSPVMHYYQHNDHHH